MHPDAFDEHSESLWHRCAAFHGHVCPGLALGFVATRMAMKKLREERAEDEGLVAVVENDACFADAVQVLTGCTFGKGNFIHKDFGKMALTLFSRGSGRGVRVALKGDVLGRNPEHLQLLRKMMSGQANAVEQARFKALHAQRTREILHVEPESVFQATWVDGPPPEKARMEPSTPCADCGEPTMPSKMADTPSGALCRACVQKISGVASHEKP